MKLKNCYHGLKADDGNQPSHTKVEAKQDILLPIFLQGVVDFTGMIKKSSKFLTIPRHKITLY